MLRSLFLVLVVCIALGSVLDLTPLRADEGWPASAPCVVCTARSGAAQDMAVVGASVFEGQTYYFCSPECKTQFEENPRAWLPQPIPRPAAPFTLTDLKGGSISLEAMRGQPLLLEFWATWSEPSIAQLAEVAKLEKKHRASGLRVLAISTDLGTDQAAVSPLASKKGVQHPVAIDRAEDPVWKLYGPRSLPALYLIDATGAIRAQWVGSFDKKQVEAEIAKLLR